jgi:hypothetical protein
MVPQEEGGNWDGGTVIDIRGKQNARPNPDYARYIRDWFAKGFSPAPRRPTSPLVLLATRDRVIQRTTVSLTPAMESVSTTPAPSVGQKTRKSEPVGTLPQTASTCSRTLTPRLTYRRLRLRSS